MILQPYDHQHPLFQDQREYSLERAILDTGEGSDEATAILSFRHRQSGQVRRSRFSGIQLTLGIGALSGLRGHLAVYDATRDGRGWEPGVRIEVGDTDPGGVWFWAEALEEIDSRRKGG